MSWFWNVRFFYGELLYGGYLFVYVVFKVVICDIGFIGWLSFEVFNRRLVDKDFQVLEEMVSWVVILFDKMMKDLKFNVVVKLFFSMEEL